MLDNYECYYCCKTLRIDLGDGKTEVARAPWAGMTNGFTLLFRALIDQLFSEIICTQLYACVWQYGHEDHGHTTHESSTGTDT